MSGAKGAAWGASYSPNLKAWVAVIHRRVLVKLHVDSDGRAWSYEILEAVAVLKPVGENAHVAPAFTVTDSGVLDEPTEIRDAGDALRLAIWVYEGPGSRRQRELHKERKQKGMVVKW